MGMMLILGLILAVIGGLWLLVEAFRTSIVWGLVCLFLPIVQIGFVIAHWDRAWKPFMVNVVGSLIIASQLLSAMPNETETQSMAAIQEELNQRVQRGEMTGDEAKAESIKLYMALMRGGNYVLPASKGDKGKDLTLRPERGQSSLDDVDVDAKIADAIAKEDRYRYQGEQGQESEPTRYRVYKSITAREAGDYIGETIKVTTHKGLTREGTLMAIKDTNLVISQFVYGGNVTYTLSPGEIAMMEVYTWSDQ